MVGETSSAMEGQETAFWKKRESFFYFASGLVSVCFEAFIVAPFHASVAKGLSAFLLGISEIYHELQLIFNNVFNDLLNHKKKKAWPIFDRG